MRNDFWEGKKVLITGHTGFKGSWLSIWLHLLGATVKGYALSPADTSLFQMARLNKVIDSYIGDIRDFPSLNVEMNAFKPDIVFHLAAQPLVKYSYHAPVETYDVNVMGTVNLLEACRHCPSVKAIVNVTTDKVYENQEKRSGYDETDPLGGYDPYSNSKACSELVTSSYVQSFFNPADYAQHGVAIATARAGNVIGGGDWAQDRLVPDLMRALRAKEKIVVRNPHSVRPWQHVLEPLYGYIVLAQQLYSENTKWNGAWNFGPLPEDAVSVTQLISMFQKKHVGSFPEVEFIGSLEHETTYLQLNIEKALNCLGWKPRWNLEYTVTKILDWYGSDPASAYTISCNQIQDYMHAIKGEHNV